ncbi:MAG TPA: Ig-like domain repeat protein, partial [Usitatibacter sp.]|nr:Ig-like domain repeat protein [Usitatibacter sp.]
MTLSRPISALVLFLAHIASAAYAQSFPPSPYLQIAVNPITNRVYSANGDANTVSVFKVASGEALTTVPVGQGANYIGINTATNRIFVNNTRDASLSVIDGASNTVIGTHAIGSAGPIAVNPTTNVIYIARLTASGTGEVTYFDANSSRWYAISTGSSRTNAIAVNPVTNKIYVSNYAGGDIRVISGAYNEANDHPATVSVAVHRNPLAVAVNPVTNKIYVVTDSTTQPLAIIDGASNTAMLPGVAPGHGQLGQSVIVNPVTNKAYAAFANEVAVIDGSGAVTFIPIANASSGVTSLGIDYGTNRIYALNASGSLNVIDGDSNTVLGTLTLGAGTTSISVNPVNHALYYYQNGLRSVGNVYIGGTERPIPITTTITPPPGNSIPANGSLTITAASTFAPTAPPIRKVYFQLDSTQGAWTPASGSGPFTAPIGDLPPGSHKIYAFAVDGQDALLATGPQSNALIGTVASHTFTVTSVKSTPSLSLLSSQNPVAPSTSVTFTVSAGGSAGTPTGTIDFIVDDGIPFCTRTLANGTASCTTSFNPGTYVIKARYSGDATYDPATSSISQRVKYRTGLAISGTPNPAYTGTNVAITIGVNGPVGTPTGTVRVEADSVPIEGCSALVLTNGSATCNTSTLTAGRKSISAFYSGDDAYGPGFGTYEQTINQNLNTATIGLASSTATTSFGQPVTFTATLGGSAGTPTGTIAFRDGTATLFECSAVTVSSGKAACTLSGLAPGAHSITARYSGDTNYNPGDSNTVGHTVATSPPAPTAAWKRTQNDTPTLSLYIPQNVGDIGPRTAVDAAGNLFVAAVQNFQGGNCAVYLKYSGADGAELWRKSMCQPNFVTFSSGVAVDSAGDALVVGAKGGDLYVAKYAGGTGAALWERQIEGPTGAGLWGLGIGLDAAGNARVIGILSGRITVYGIRGSDGATQWERSLPAPFSTKAYAFAVDSAGNSVVGERRTIDSRENSQDTLTRLDAAGAVTWEAVVQGTPAAIAIDSAGDVIASGLGGLQKRSASSGALLWTLAYDVVAIKTDAGNNVYATGRTRVGFDSDADVFTIKAAPDGALLWRNVLVDPSTYTSGGAITLDAAGNPIVSGTMNLNPPREFTIKYASGDGRILWRAEETAGNDGVRNYSVNATGSGPIVLGVVSGSSPGALYLVKYGEAGAPTGSTDLAITQSAPSAGGTGKDVMYTVTVTNNGPAGATGVNVSDTLPAGSTFVWASQGCTRAGGTVTCNVGSLAVNASRTVKVVVRPASAGTATNTA